MKIKLGNDEVHKLCSFNIESSTSRGYQNLGNDEVQSNLDLLIYVDTSTNVVIPNMVQLADPYSMVVIIYFQ